MALVRRPNQCKIALWAEILIFQINTERLREPIWIEIGTNVPIWVFLLKKPQISTHVSHCLLRFPTKLLPGSAWIAVKNSDVSRTSLLNNSLDFNSRRVLKGFDHFQNGRAFPGPEIVSSKPIFHTWQRLHKKMFGCGPTASVFAVTDRCTSEFFLSASPKLAVKQYLRLRQDTYKRIVVL